MRNWVDSHIPICLLQYVTLYKTKKVIVMKKAILILGFLVISLSAFAQAETNVKQSDLKGPAYKNYKYWMHKTEPTIVYSDNSKKDLTGPAYKNYLPSSDASKQELVAVNTSGSEKQKLTGPAYKNHGAWSKK